ncbi:hypothetical protein PC118_g10826 [Phytophthora cactorum]|uniref:Uncharacterized protein n=1 Tax=Phytophthora cactorum TaxID=29920 RepID=A0A8T0Z2H2_9STRA|nr:hypothetical protein PC113_g11611 [Phytophthora cactorum]KAG2919075.1 hypothetical protein PC115_g10294 [Phytophthora cactorum]KAG2981093.1 hypothetical protein PC118_g10826 [Phytophthora cactorum]KAG3017671.1 hypothetical protein PC120_g10898 [Phytophthora cactorum]KAG3085614.1 hypothetical protein PC122_g9579 [Phytophthora cactorum]
MEPNRVSEVAHMIPRDVTNRGQHSFDRQWAPSCACCGAPIVDSKESELVRVAAAVCRIEVDRECRVDLAEHWFDWNLEP